MAEMLWVHFSQVLHDPSFAQACSCGQQYWSAHAAQILEFFFHFTVRPQAPSPLEADAVLAEDVPHAAVATNPASIIA